MTDRGDGDLIAAVAAGDAEALLTLYDRYGRLAFGLAYRVLGEAGAAEEAVQDAFLQLWRRAATFDPARGSARAWLLAVVHHRAIDLRRRQGSRGSAASIDDLADRLAGPSVWPEVAATLQRDQVRDAMATLPVDQQWAIQLAYFDGLSHREIAAQTGMPLGTVKGRLRLGLRKLAGLLAEPNVVEPAATDAGA